MFGRIPCGAGLFIACLNFASHRLEHANPKLALALDPFNTNARMGLIGEGLADPDATSADLNGLLALGDAGARFAPVDARMWSVIGDIRARLGDQAAAQGYYSRALAISKTEIHALLNTFDDAIAHGDYGRALDCADIVLRRWPGQAGRVQAAIRALADDPSGYKALLDRLTAAPPWRDKVLGAFRGSADAAMLGYRLLLDLEAAGHPAAAGAVAATAGDLIRFGRVDAAYRLFLLTRTPDERAQAGYIFDGHFRLTPDGNPFGWRIDGSSGYEARTGPDGLSLRFADAPVRRIAVFEMMALPPGRYTLETEASAEAAVLPKELAWTVRCLPSTSAVASLAVPAGSYGWRVMGVDFTVGPECRLEIIALETDLAVDSWQFRYSGEVGFRSVGIRQADGGGE
jgi:hypothetical protein